MKLSYFDPIQYGQPVSRGAVLTLLDASLQAREFRFTRQLALTWLAVFPGDLGINLYLARALAGEERPYQLQPILENLVRQDPEFLAAQQMIASGIGISTQDAVENARASVFALGGRIGTVLKLPEWSLQLRSARDALRKNDLTGASDLTAKSLAANPESPLPAIMHLQVLRKLLDDQVYSLSEVYHQRWPDCLQFSLFLAEAKLKNGDESGAVGLLHHCAANDLAGQVPTRIWGPDYPYRPIWPDHMEIPFDLPIPASVAGILGWNQLPQPSTSPTDNPGDQSQSLPGESNSVVQTNEGLPQSEPVPSTDDRAGKITGNRDVESLRSVQMELDKLAKRLKKAGPSRVEGRFPIYVVFSTRRGLESQYGEQTAQILIEEMNRLVAAVRKRPNWGALLFLADDPASTTALGIKPAPANDPWKLKLALTDLDASLGKRGEMIGALLIVGGPTVVPFHRLPNPTDDADREVPSDNPYATLDENYFVPEWPVGRLPGEASSDAGLLLSSLRDLVSYHSSQNQPRPLWQRLLLDFLIRLFSPRFKFIGANGKMQPSFGYTAAVWKNSSLAVFRPIGEPRSMLISPPARTGSPLESGLAPAHVEYYNLHGVNDAAEWYGQRDLTQPGSGPDYPIALTPKDITNDGRIPGVVFTEACYGAFIDGKTVDQALSLKFLSSGVRAFVGSTTISYGSMATPLIAADFLGNGFLKRVSEGQPIGSALQQAKIALVQEMNNRQGFLDGEDQKTLISFVLYGDPLVSMDGIDLSQKTVMRARERLEVKTTSEAPEQEGMPERIPMEIVNQVKQIVDQYLPGLRDAELTFARQRINLSDDAMAKDRKDAQTHRLVVTLSKKTQISNRTHRHYARMTLDPHGKVLKLSISR